MEIGSEKLGAAKYSIYVNVFLIFVKLAAGIYTGSLGIIAEFLHSLFDLMASALAYWGIHKGMKPADRTHLYGHERMENVSSFIQSALITITSVVILFEAYGRTISGEHIVRESLVGIAVMVMTMAIDVVFSRYLHRKSRETGSPALEADAYHFTTDILSTGAVLLGLFATFLGYPVADILSAVFVAMVMIYLSYNIGKKAISVMIDHAPDTETVERLTAIVTNYPDVKGYHSLRARISGNKVFVDVSIHLDKKITLERAHKISEKLEREIKQKNPIVKEVVVHVEPESPHDGERKRMLSRK
jgi:cation diffusion facilitator family transporter